MKVKGKLLISTVILAIFNLLFCMKALSIELKTAAQDSAPKFFKGADGRITGICVDIIKAINEEAGSDFEITGYENFIPAKRYKLMLEDGELDLMLGLSKNPEREKRFQYIDIPLYSVKHVIVSRADANLQINSIEDIIKKRLSVISILGTGSAKYAKQIFGEELVSSVTKRPETLMRMLIANRGDLVYYHNLGIMHEIRRGDLFKKVTIQPVIPREYSHYLAMSRKTSKDIVKKVYDVVLKLKQNGRLDDIYKKYAAEDL